MRYAYPYELSEQPEGGFTVTFPDVPEAITQGETEADAARMAEDALVTALSFYADDAEPPPHPSPALGRRLAYVPPLVAVKLALHAAMLAAGVSNVVLARRLGVDEKIVRRLRDPLHNSRIDQVGQALRELGKVVEVVVREAGPGAQEAGSREWQPIDPFSKNWMQPRVKSIVPSQHFYNKKQRRSRLYPKSGLAVPSSSCSDAQRKRNQQRVIGMSAPLYSQQ